jgi:carbonyl reductase 1
MTLKYLVVLMQLGYKPLYHQLDVEDQNSIDRFKQFLEETHGGLDLLVNNAAIAYKVTQIM